MYLFAADKESEAEDSDPEMDICVLEDEHSFEFIHRRLPGCTTHKHETLHKGAF